MEYLECYYMPVTVARPFKHRSKVGLVGETPGFQLSSFTTQHKCLTDLKILRNACVSRIYVNVYQIVILRARSTESSQFTMCRCRSSHIYDVLQVKTFPPRTFFVFLLDVIHVGFLFRATPVVSELLLAHILYTCTHVPCCARMTRAENPFSLSRASASLK